MLLKNKLLLVIFSGFLFLIGTQFHQDKSVPELKNKYAPKPSQFISISGMNVHYRIEGTGSDLLLIHGTSSSLHTWDGWVKELATHHRIIRLDIPAFGLTGAHPHKDYSIPSYVIFIDQFTKALKLNSFHIAGNSLGGHIAWLYAASHPQKVKSLILLNSAGFPMEKRIWIFEIARMPVVSTIMRYFTPRFLIANNLRQVYWDDQKINPSLTDRYFDLTLREGNRAALIDRAKTPYKDHTQMLQKISAPVLIMWGEHDSWIPVSHALLFQKKIKQAELKIYPNAGHIPMEEIPLDTARDAYKFLAAVK